MALVDPDRFDDDELTMIYIAGRLSESKRVEQVLSDNAIDYTVDGEPFESRILGIIPVQYEGIAFYVLTEQADFCRRALHDAGLIEGLVAGDAVG